MKRVSWKFQTKENKGKNKINPWHKHIISILIIFKPW
jgi:hypothetical protein